MRDTVLTYLFAFQGLGTAESSLTLTLTLTLTVKGLGTADKTVCRILGCADKQEALKIAAAFERKCALLRARAGPPPARRGLP